MMGMIEPPRVVGVILSPTKFIKESDQTTPKSS